MSFRTRWNHKQKGKPTQSDEKQLRTILRQRAAEASLDRSRFFGILEQSQDDERENENLRDNQVDEDLHVGNEKGAANENQVSPTRTER